MKRVRPEKLSSKKMQELMQKYNGKRSKEFSDEQVDVYELNNGQLILKHKFVSSGVLYNNVEEYRTVHEETIKMSPLPKSILSDYQMEIQQLQKGSDDFIKQLSEKLSFEVDPLNCEEKNIQSLSTSINKYLEENDYEKLYFPLVVFIGEYIKNKVKGEWLFKPNDPDTEVLEIFVVDQNGERSDL